MGTTEADTPGGLAGRSRPRAAVTTVPRGLRTILSTIGNASAIPVTPEMVLAMLRNGEGQPSHLRALFGDVDAVTLDRVAATAGIEPATWLVAYGRARSAVGAANPALDALLAERTGDRWPADHDVMMNERLRRLRPITPAH